MKQTVISSLGDLLAEILRVQAEQARLKIARDVTEFGSVTTAALENDPEQPYATGFTDSRYESSNPDMNGAMLEAYKTREEALEGHKRWIEKIRAGWAPATIEGLPFVCNGDGTRQQSTLTLRVAGKRPPVQVVTKPAAC